LLVETGRAAEAQRLAERVVAMRAKLLGPRHAETGFAHLHLAWVLASAGADLPRAERELAEALSIYAERRRARTRQDLTLIAAVEIALRHPREALAALDEAAALPAGSVASAAEIERLRGAAEGRR
jgi:hypothetical protein